jgi:hypothetical protein
MDTKSIWVKLGMWCFRVGGYEIVNFECVEEEGEI